MEAGGGTANCQLGALRAHQVQSAFCGWDTGTERVCDTPKVTQQVSRKPGLCPQAEVPWGKFSFFLPSLFLFGNVKVKLAVNKPQREEAKAGLLIQHKSIVCLLCSRHCSKFGGHQVTHTDQHPAFMEFLFLGERGSSQTVNVMRELYRLLV